MLETQKLYEEDPYLRTFRARVLSCEREKHGWAVVLDRTAFFPEGGGQPGDQGVLDRVNVLDTRERGDKVVHLTDAPLPVGSQVTGGIHWPLRHQHMQEHTGEHILSGVLHRFFGVTNVGFHMGSACVTLDLDKPLEPHQIALGERLANEAVWRDLPVLVSYPTQVELETLDYRSKKEIAGQVRIVTIPGYDVCACCGTHVAHTGEIGMVKVLDSMHYKGGVRISMVCGRRAFADYGQKLAAVSAISGQLSAKPETVADAVTHLLEEKEHLQQQLHAAQDHLVAVLAESVQPLPNGWACAFAEGLAPDALRRFALSLAEKAPNAAAVLSGDGQHWQYALATKDGDLRAVCKEMNAAFQGRGGGKPGLVQGSLQSDRETLEAWFAKR